MSVRAGVGRAMAQTRVILHCRESFRADDAQTTSEWYKESDILGRIVKLS